MTLPRGFKADAERRVNEFRQQLKLKAAEGIDPQQLAKRLEIEVVAADALIDRARLIELDEIQPGAFSACTFRVAVDRSIIVYNPLNSLARTQSDIAHELAHLLLGHELSRVERVGELTFYTCDSNQEEQASWFSGCLLLPRDLLVGELRKGRSIRQIADRFGVSEQMARYRVNASGAATQLSRARQRRP